VLVGGDRSLVDVFVGRDHAVVELVETGRRYR
jgi:hypothetical protein